MTMLGHNIIGGDPLSNTQATLELLREDAKRWRDDTPTADTAGIVRDAIDACVKVASAADRHRMEEKRPHMDAGAAVDDKWRPVIDEAKRLADDLRRAVKRFMDAEREAARIAAEAARKAAEEERRKAAEAMAADDDDPFAEYEAQEAMKAAAEANTKAAKAAAAADGKIRVAGLESGARALSTRTTYEVDVADGPALVTHFATHPEIIEACRKLAAAQVRAAKGHAAIPGIVVRAIEKVA